MHNDTSRGSSQCGEASIALLQDSLLDGLGPRLVWEEEGAVKWAHLDPQAVCVCVCVCL